MAKKKWTQSQKDYVEIAMSFGCIITGQKNDIVWHHVGFCSGASQRPPHSMGFPLTKEHHTDGGAGVAIHASLLMFEGNFGTEAELYEKSNFKVLGW